MVNIEIEEITNKEIDEFNKILEDIPKEVDNIPEPPAAIFNRMSKKEQVKELHIFLLIKEHD